MAAQNTAHHHCPNACRDEETAGEFHLFLQQMVVQMIGNHAEGEGVQLGGTEEDGR